MPDILHRVGIQSPVESVFEALATVEGLSHWWLTGTTGDAKLGGTIHFRPDGGGFDMKVAEARPNERVTWRCIGGPPEWIGTEVTFQLQVKQGQTFVLFTHANWKEPVEFMHHCSTKWATFLLSLKSWLERGEGRPFPYDVKIHVGD
jgi:uncharacterized protein YndB with AHSA1/START domain